MNIQKKRIKNIISKTVSQKLMFQMYYLEKKIELLLTYSMYNSFFYTILNIKYEVYLYIYSIIVVCVYI